MSLDMLKGWILLLSHIVVTDSVIIENFEIFLYRKQHLFSCSNITTNFRVTANMPANSEKQQRLKK